MGMRCLDGLVFLTVLYSAVILHCVHAGQSAVETCAINNKVEGWTLGMRVYTGSGDSPYHMWLGSSPRNDDDTTCASWTVSSDVTTSLKSRLVESEWDQISEIRIAMYTKGQLKAYIDFNVMESTKANFMNKQRILRSSYTDITTAKSDYFSVQGVQSCARRFYAQHFHGGCHKDQIWIDDVDTHVQCCDWEKCGPRPCFVYSKLTTRALYTNMAFADLFVLLYKVSACSAGRWGIGCQSKCHCANNAVCNRDSGQCPGTCSPGWMGLTCNVCDTTYWGATCESPYHCAGGATCDQTRGRCPLGCAAGWTGNTCSDPVCGASDKTCNDECICPNNNVCLPYSRGQSLTPDTNYPRDCADVKVSDRCASSGVYQIYPEGRSGARVKAYCDMDTDHGGWTIIQRRDCGCLDFYQTWESYKHGFGCLKAEHWLGNKHIYDLTNDTERPMALLVTLEDWSCPAVTQFAHYNTFSLASEDDNFSINVNGYSGNAGDAMSAHDGAAFSTRDRDNDENSGGCAVKYKGGWWYKACYQANLNGLYHTGGATEEGGVVWNQWKGFHYSLQKAEMKVRVADF